MLSSVAHLHPASRPGALADGVQGQCDIDRFLRGGARPCVLFATNQTRKRFRLKSKAVAVGNLRRFERNRHGNAPADLQHRRPAGRRVVQIIGLDDALVARNRGVAVKRRGEAAGALRQQPAREFQIGDGRQIDPVGVVLRHGLDPNGAGAGDDADEADGITAGVVERAAAKRRVQANVGWIDDLESGLPLFKTSLDLTGVGIYRKDQVLIGSRQVFSACGPKNLFHVHPSDCSRVS